jgi:3-dehydroquinate synthase
MIENVHVPLGDRAYDVVIGPGLLAQAGARIAPLLARPRIAVASDETVAALHWDTLRKGLEINGISADCLTLGRVWSGLSNGFWSTGSSVATWSWPSVAG